MHKALAKFNGWVSNWITLGVLAILAGAIMAIIAMSHMEFTWISVGVLFILLGTTSLTWGVFAMLLRQTALVIVEGLSGATPSSAVKRVAEAVGKTIASSNDPKAEKPAARQSDENIAFSQFNGREFRAWEKANRPSLDGWLAEGEPDFLTWLEENR